MTKLRFKKELKELMDLINSDKPIPPPTQITRR